MDNDQKTQTDRNGPDALTPLDRALAKLYEVAGGGMDSDNVRAARLTTAQRTAYFRSPEFRAWVASEKAAGRQIFWLKDVDKTQAAGDIFTLFFEWKAKNNKFTPQQLAVISSFLLARQNWLMQLLILAVRACFGLVNLLGLNLAMPAFASLTPADVLRLWEQKERGGEGIDLLEFWSGAYWPSQVGLTREEKQAQLREFIPHYVKHIYAGVPEENRTLEEVGVNVVIVSNGDQELAGAAAEVLGIKPENVVGSPLIYGTDGRATGAVHSYEAFGAAAASLPQPGKHLNFHYWMYVNKGRWGWAHLNERNIVIAGRDGDSASADGGMMILLHTPAIGNFMIDTPGEPDRIKKFYRLAAKYGWTRGQFFTLVQEPSQKA